MTIEATFQDGSVMLFGDSYRKWWDQLAEYCRTFGMPRPRVRICRSKWVGHGGLKWCPPHQLQDALDDEGLGRRASDFTHWRSLNRVELRTLNKHVRS